MPAFSSTALPPAGRNRRAGSAPTRWAAACLAAALLPLAACASGEQTPALPTALQGQWTPISRALETAGPLHLSANSITWQPCGKAAHAVQPVTAQTGPKSAAPDAAQSPATLLALAGEPACQLDGTPVSHLRLQARPAPSCDMEVSLYQNAAQLAQGERLAWGVFTRTGCTAVAQPTPPLQPGSAATPAVQPRPPAGTR